MATNPTSKMAPSMQSQNGVITAPPKGVVGGNRKKQKRRAKQAAKVAAQDPMMAHEGGQAADGAYDDEQLGYPEDDEYSDDAQYDEDDHYSHHPAPNGHPPQHHMPPPVSRSKNSRKKKQPQGQLHRDAYDSSMLPPMPHAPPPRSRAQRPGQSQPAGLHHHPNIWNTSSQQERQNIKDFWLSLSEDERKALLKIEKEAVLKKMKQQQKHSCSCTVCGRKRTAIEEELEVLYEGYYEELEQYAHHDQPPLPNADGLMPDPLQHRRPHPLATPPPTLQYRKTSNMHEHLDEEEYSDEGDEEYSDEEEEEEDDEEYSDDELEPEPEPLRAHQGVPDFFNFGSHLTVKDNLLTVADDLLKNDGRKFIEMMEQLAERRMQRESRSQYEAENHNGYPPDDPAYAHDDPLAGGDEFDDEEGSYDSQEEYDDDMDEEDEMVGDIELASHEPNQTDHLQDELTEEQRMQEGRRMFQIFAARMFEQRVLQAYREKVAAERQRKLLEELEDEDKQHAQKEAKRQRDAQKKKDKKKQAQQAKAEEKARRDAEKAAEEARLKEAEEKKLEESRRKKEEQRKKREEEKRRLEEEKAKKEADKLRRQQEEQQRREEAERKARELKAAEKAKKEEARKKEREEKEAREKEARDRKLQEEKERKDREARSRAEREAKDRERASQPTHANPPQITKRPSQAGMVAIPGLYPKNTNSGISSPHPTIATPAVPKANAPAKQRQPSQQGSHASSPKQAQSQMSSAPSKSSSPASSGPIQNPIQPKTIMQKVNNQHPGGQLQQSMPTSTPLQHHPLQPPPGMPNMQHHHPGGFGTMGPMGFPGFPGPQGPMMPNMAHRGQMPMFPQQGPYMGVPNRMPFGPGINGVGLPGMMSQPQHRGFPFDAPGAQPPPGFGHTPHPALPQQTSPIGPPQSAPGTEQQRNGLAGHSRQASVDKFDSAASQPISRPAPIKRPRSDKPANTDRPGPAPDVDDLSKHLGSSALLDDTDEPMPPSLADARRHSSIAPGARNISIPSTNLSQMAGFGGPIGGGGVSFGNASSNWNPAPNMSGLPFGQSPNNLSQPNWGSLPSASNMNSWSNSNHTNASAFSNNAAFGNIGGHPGAGIHRPSAVGLNRPLTIRLAVCQACKQLSSSRTEQSSSSKSPSPDNGNNDGYHDVDTLLKQIEKNRPMLDTPPTLREIEEICETEGDSQNGGGELYVRRTAEEGKAFLVKWEPDVLTPDAVGGGGGRGGPLAGLGEIGSPLPSKSSPAMGFGFGAPGRGRVGSQFQGLGPI